MTGIAPGNDRQRERAGWLEALLGDAPNADHPLAAGPKGDE